jgi:hypothetical protein
MLRFGKHPTKQDFRTLRFKKYVKSNLPAPPASHDALATVYNKLHVSDPKQLFPMDGNDRYGDCTIAALAHAITVYCGLIGEKRIWPAREVEKLYFHLSGGLDSGLNELDVLNYWHANTVDGDQILAYAKIDVTNHTHVKLAMQLFGGVYLGFQVQENCVEDFNARKPWTPAPLTREGHAVYAVGFDDKGVTVLTWGNTQTATWDWWDECVDEAYAILPPEAKIKDFSPGFDFNQLKDDLADVSTQVFSDVAVLSALYRQNIKLNSLTPSPSDSTKI